MNNIMDLTQLSTDLHFNTYVCFEFKKKYIFLMQTKYCAIIKTILTIFLFFYLASFD